jgi:hypothetical protein
MGAYDDVIKMIRQEIDRYPVSEMGEMEIDSLEIDRFPDPEEFVNPKPDIESEGPLKGRDVLGSYRPMRSPGVITLYPQNLSNFFWSMIKSCYRKARINFITRPDMERVLHLVVTKTYQHELFHFGSDVLRTLFASNFDPFKEEALAVAYARQQILLSRANGNSQIGRLDGVIFHTVLREAFQYRSLGYREWVNFSDEWDFKQGLLDYFSPGGYQFLRQNNVPVEDLLYPVLGRVSGYLERVV